MWGDEHVDASSSSGAARAVATEWVLHRDVTGLPLEARVLHESEVGLAESISSSATCLNSDQQSIRGYLYNEDARCA